MARMTVDAKAVLCKLEAAKQAVQRDVVEAVNDCADDLIRVSSEIAPHDKGILEKSHAREVAPKGDQVTATIAYSVNEGEFNYAMAMHEREYNLGPGSSAKPGTEGMSGTHYSVGNKYLTRPLEGEAKVYREHITQILRNAIKRECD
ncbi:hypothetical protein [Heliophilum fasciatum]|uniref:HK97 gp10 family phage protein n=1 Tax=Heliophilum fasciatum TaxID=35700 RepID=A0A4V6NRK7_9FIRM|nr:hypothetical protein [Heliophilum fasciatum]MCW2279106.1 hypothetical protein [Heliophilum fasciatum]TCP61266.1 hypothetical protein EDD73_12919 [Heliophilum fasciatum]